MVPRLGLIVAATAPAFVPHASWADSVTISQTGAWRSYVTRSPSGRTVCGATTNFRDGRQFYLKWEEGGQNLFIQIFKPGWMIPAGVSADIILRLDKSTPWSVKTTRLDQPGNFVEFNIGKASVREFTHDFTVSTSMLIEFKGGTESPWLVDLTGNSGSVDSLVKCIVTVAGPDNASHPYAYTRLPSQPFATSPTPSQPFAAPPYAPAMNEPATRRRGENDDDAGALKDP